MKSIRQIGRRLSWIVFPYCLLKSKQSDGYVILNRGYKPIGFNCNENIQYEQYPIVHKIKITPKTAQLLSWKNDRNTETIHLYGNISNPKSMQDYLKRLTHLSKLLSKKVV